MATTSPQPSDIDRLALEADLPGHTVDALLAEGKVEEAREELESLLQEGIDSGPGIEVTPAFWAELKAEIRQNSATKRWVNAFANWSLLRRPGGTSSTGAIT